MYAIDVPNEVLSRFSKVICDGCRSTLIYNSSDIIADRNYSDFASIFSDFSEKQVVARYVIRCPVCGKYIDV